MNKRRNRKNLLLSFLLIPQLGYAELLELEATAVELFGDIRFTDFNIVFDDTGDGLLQFEEIVSFSGVDEVLEPFRSYDDVVYVPEISGVSTATGTINPDVPCSTCWEFTPGSFGASSDGWFVDRWAYSISVVDTGLLLEGLRDAVSEVLPGNGLSRILIQAQAFVEAEDTIAACAMLNAFTQHISAVGAKKLTEQAANELLETAEMIKMGVGCE